MLFTASCLEKQTFNTLASVCSYVSSLTLVYHGVQNRMISVDNFFVFLRLLFFAVLLLYLT